MPEEQHMSPLEITQVALVAVNFVRVFPIIYLVLQTSVSGYCTAEAPYSVAHAWALVIPLLSVFLVQNVVRFEPNRRIEETAHVIRITAYTIVASGLSNAFAFLFFAYELNVGKSYFYVQSKPYLIATVVVSGFMTMCDVAVFICLRGYTKELLSPSVKTSKKND